MNFSINVLRAVRRSVVLAIFVGLIASGCETHSSSYFIRSTGAASEANQFVGNYVRVRNVGTGRYISTTNGAVTLAAANAQNVDNNEFFVERIFDPSGKPMFVLGVAEDRLESIKAGTSFRMTPHAATFENVVQFGRLSNGTGREFLINTPVPTSAAQTRDQLKVAWTDVDGQLSLQSSRNPLDPDVRFQLWEVEVVTTPGPADLTALVGQWELNSTFHSNDNNEFTAIEIAEKSYDGLLEKHGWKAISMTFEDGFTVNCRGRAEVVQCTNGYSIPQSAQDGFYLVDRIGNRDLIKRYRALPAGYLLVHNGAAYAAHTWASWTEIGYGGKATKQVTPKASLNPLGNSAVLGITDEKLFVVPARHRDLKIFVDPEDGVDRVTTISNPPVDNSCYRVRGDLISAEVAYAAGERYKYVDRDCAFSSNAMRQARAKRITESEGYQTILSRVTQAHSEGFFDNIDPHDTGHHEKIRSRILAPTSKAATSTLDQDDDGKIHLNGNSEQNSALSIDSMSIGLIETAEFIIGETGDAGVIMDFATPAYGRAYATIGGTFGIEAGATAGLVLGFWDQRVCDMTDGQSIGLGAEVVFDVGVGGAVWFGLGEHRPSGFSIALVYGLDGRAVTAQLVHTFVKTPSVFREGDPAAAKEYQCAAL